MSNVASNKNEKDYTSSSRDYTLDILKGIAIILMVGGHCAFPVKDFIYLFHMAIFFMASGYFYKPEKTSDFTGLKSYVIKKLKGLWVPYVLWSTVFILLHNFFIRINVYTDNPLLLTNASGKHLAVTEYIGASEMLKNIVKAVFLHGGTEIGSAFWFLATLLEVSLLYGIIDYLIKKMIRCVSNHKTDENNNSKSQVKSSAGGDKKQSGNTEIFDLEINTKYIDIIQLIISIAFLAVGYICHITGHSFAGLGRVLSYYILFFIGYVIKNHSLSLKNSKISAHILVFVLSFTVLIICYQFGRIDLGNNSYVNPIFLLIASCAGWYFLYEISLAISANVLSKLFIVIGQNTLPILIFHFLCFKLVNLAGVLIQSKPLYLIAAFPVLYHHSAWWVAYTFVGVVIPVVLSVVYKKLVHKGYYIY